MAPMCSSRSLDAEDPARSVWKPLKEVLPDYWMTAFPDEIDAAWTG